MPGCENPEGEAQSYFQNLFCLPHDISMATFDIRHFPTLSHEAREALTGLVSKEEVKHALMCMKSHKLPNLDGFQFVFFKKYWDTIQNNIWQLFRKAFVEGYSKEKLVETLVVLIPKLDHTKQFRDFLPISLCNILHKLISKVLVHRLCPYLEEIINPLQGSFVFGRGTTDNAIMAQEVVHHMHRSKANEGIMAFKFNWKRTMTE